MSPDDGGIDDQIFEVRIIGKGKSRTPSRAETRATESDAVAMAVFLFNKMRFAI
jgi:hypothetical protein